MPNTAADADHEYATAKIVRDDADRRRGGEPE